MIYRNGFKEYFISGIIFGIPMGLLGVLQYRSLFIGLLSGVLCGVLFALFIFIFIKITEKKFDKMRVEIASTRKIICDGGATVNGNGGWLFFTERGLEFYPHKINLSTKEVFLPFDALRSVSTKGNQIIIEDATGAKLVAVVSKNKEWKKQIDAVIEKV